VTEDPARRVGQKTSFVFPLCGNEAKQQSVIKGLSISSRCHREATAGTIQNSFLLTIKNKTK